jgi:3-hydroxybutyryl-CoA dehydratase
VRSIMDPSEGLRVAVPETGDTLGPWRFDRIEPARIARMSKAQHDPNPIHLDPAAVAAVNLGDRQVNQGSANAAYVMNMLAEAIPEGTIERFTVRLLANVFAGDTVVAGGVVESVEGQPGDQRLHCRVWLDVEDGSRAVEGRAVIHFAGA